jgi:membrane fusion protein (multidrug efflux system)
VEVTVLQHGDLSTWLEASGTLEARNSAMLVAERAGRVVALRAEEGDRVATGAVLAQLDDADALLAVQRAEVEFEAARRDAERGRQMRAQGYLSAKEMDDLDLRQRSAEVALGQARLDLSRTRIVAPFGGRVTLRNVNLGETVPAGRDCFRVEDFSPLRARVYFPERELGRIRVGQQAEVRIDGAPGRHAARVALVNPSVEGSNGTFKVTLELPNPDGVLRPGAFAQVRLRTGDVLGALLVPRRGVMSQDGESYVFVARGDSAVRVPVTVGAEEGERAQILSGLAAGDSVVTVGQGGLKQGSKIRVVSF